MKTWTMVAVALALAFTAGCKKKEKDQKTGTTGSAAKPAEPPKPPEPPQPPKPAAKTGKDLAQVYIDCANLMQAGKYDDFMSQCAADNFVAHNAGDQDMKRDEVPQMMKDMKAAFPDQKMAPQLIFVNGRNVAAVVYVAGTHEGPMKMPGMPEIPATKKKFGQLLYHRLAINEENKATEEWVYFDPATMMSQLGLAPKGTPPARPVMAKGLVDAPVIIVAADDDKEKMNLELVKKANEAFNAKKTADVMAAYADNAMESDQAGDKDMKGKKEIEKGMAMFWKGFSDGKIEVTGMWAAGDYVVVEGTFSGTNDGPLGKMPKTGKKIEKSPYAEIVKIQDGKITELWRFRNGMEMAKQMGLMPEMKGGDMKGAEPKKM